MSLFLVLLAARCSLSLSLPLSPAPVILVVLTQKTSILMRGTLVSCICRISKLCTPHIFKIQRSDFILDFIIDIMFLFVNIYTVQPKSFYFLLHLLIYITDEQNEFEGHRSIFIQAISFSSELIFFPRDIEFPVHLVIL